MPTVFRVDADAAAAIQELLKLRQAERGVGESLKDIVTASNDAGKAMSASAPQGLREYELAGNAIKRNAVMPLPRTGDVQAFRRRGNGSTYDLALVSPRVPQPISNADSSYALAGGSGAGNMFMMNRLLGRGQASVGAGNDRADADAERADAEAERANQLATVERQAAIQSMGTRLRKQEQSRKTFSANMQQGAAAVAATFGILEQASERYAAILEETGAAGVAFEGEVRGLLSLGDNAKHGQQIRQSVMAMSNAYGMDTGQISNAQFMLSSAASNLGPQVQQQIMQAGVGLNQVAGGDLQEELVAVTKLMQTYGHELGTADMAASKLLATEDKAAITLGELSSLLPDVLPAAKLMGHTYDEVAASVITATQVLGNNDKTLTGLRNTFLKLGQAQQEGLIHQGAFTDQLMELSKVPPVELERIFGERTVSIVAALADHVGELKDHLKEMGDVVAGDVFKKFLDEQNDPERRASDRGASLDEHLKNIPKIRFADEKTRETDLMLKAALVGWGATAPAKLQAMMPDGLLKGLMGAAGERAYEHQQDGDDGWYLYKDKVQAGLNMDISNKINAGDAQSLFAAHLETIHNGVLTGSKVYDGKGAGHYTGESDEKEYVELSKKVGGEFGMARFQDYRNAEMSGDSARMTKDIAEATASLKQAAANLATRTKDRNAQN